MDLLFFWLVGQLWRESCADLSEFFFTYFKTKGNTLIICLTLRLSVKPHFVRYIVSPSPTFFFFFKRRKKKPHHARPKNQESRRRPQTDERNEIDCSSSGLSLFSKLGREKEDKQKSRQNFSFRWRLSGARDCRMSRPPFVCLSQFALRLLQHV